MYISPGEHENIYCVGIDRDTECKKSQTLHTEFSGFYLQLAQLAFIFVYYFIYFFYIFCAGGTLQIAIRLGSEIEKGAMQVGRKGDADWSSLDDCW